MTAIGDRIIDDRICDCGQGVQDESHVLFACPKSASVRQRFSVNDGVYGDIGELMCSMEVVTFVYECMRISN